MTKIKSSLSPEYTLLRYCAQIGISDAIKNKLDKILEADLYWPFILAESRKEGVACLLYHNLSQFKNKIPPDILSRLEETYCTNAYRNVKIYDAIASVLSLIHKEGLKMIPLKGLFLAEKVYNDIGLRAIISDIDLLVKKEDLPSIERLLENLGYSMRVHKKLLYLAMKKSYMNSVEFLKPETNLPNLHVHWHILNISLPTYLYSKKIDMSAFWKSAQPTKIADASAWQFAWHHLIMHLSEHALKHSFDRLILLSDIDAVVKVCKSQIDWQKLIAESLAYGMKKQLFYSLYFAHHYLDTPVPDHVLSGLKPENTGWAEKIFFSAVLKNQRDTTLCYFVYLGMVKGIIAKIKFVFRSLFAPPCILALTFNLKNPRVGIGDYFSFIAKQLFHLKKSISPTAQ